MKIEEGFDRARAASFAYTSTAFPMLTGTLVTAAGFLPIATAHSSTGEYTRSIFQVVTVALLISWVAAVIVIPYLGYRLLPARHGNAAHEPPRGAFGRLNARVESTTRAFYAWFRRAVDWCVGHRWLVIAATFAMFAAAAWGFRYVPQQFFPSSTRLELLVDLKLAEGSSFAATEREVLRMEKVLAENADGIDNFVSYVGTGSPRFYLPLDQQLPTPSFAQFVVTTRGIREREALRAKLIAALEDPQFTAVRGRVLRLENGPPVGFPVQFRVSGEDLGKLRGIAEQVADGDARRSGHRERAVRLGRAVQGDPSRDRSGQGARTRRLVAGPRGVPQRRAGRPVGHLLSGEGPAGRSAPAQRAAGACAARDCSRTSRCRRATAAACRSRSSCASITSWRRA